MGRHEMTALSILSEIALTASRKAYVAKKAGDAWAAEVVELLALAIWLYAGNSSTLRA